MTMRMRIPKPETDLSEQAALEMLDEQAALRQFKQPRQHWAQAFRAMAASGADELLEQDLPGQTDWDVREWQW